MLPKKSSGKEIVLAAIVLLFVTGSLILAVIDNSYRAVFADLTKVALGAYIGLLIPNRTSLN
jgi:hypothetical protein